MKKILPVLFFVFCFSAIKAQDPQFSQAYSNLLYLSPSFTGATKEYRVGLNYRNQWPKLTDELTTTSASFDYNLSNYNSGVGVIAMRDVLGTSGYTNTTVGVSYAYDVKINRNLSFRPGIALRYSINAIDFNSLNFSTNIDMPGYVPPYRINKDKVTSFDGALSGLLLHNRFWTGVTVDHLFSPNVSFSNAESKIPMKISVFGGYKFQKIQRVASPVKKELSLAAAYRHQGVHDQIDFGLYNKYDFLLFGILYRNMILSKEYSSNDALVFIVGIQYEGLKFGYSYDITMSKLYGSTNGSHELALVYEFEIDKKKKYRAMPCP